MIPYKSISFRTINLLIDFYYIEIFSLFYYYIYINLCTHLNHMNQSYDLNYDRRDFYVLSIFYKYKYLIIFFS